MTLDIGCYASAVLFDEWPKMRHGASSDVAQTRVVTAARIGVEEFSFPAVERAYDAMRRAECIKAVVTV